MAGFLVWLVWLGGSGSIFAADVVLTESQVKALCLLNFAKYVNWPADTFSSTNAPFYCGVVGRSKLATDLKTAANGKFVSGHAIVILDSAAEEDWRKCQILFISASEKGHLPEIFETIKTLPVLSIGESERFVGSGGIINFIKKENKVRFEIDLSAARQARLQISSKLLSLADSIQGRTQ